MAYLKLRSVPVETVQKDTGVDITISGIRVLHINAEGYLSRYEDLPESLGVKRNDDGALAFRRGTL